MFAKIKKNVQCRVSSFFSSIKTCVKSITISFFFLSVRQYCFLNALGHQRGSVSTTPRPLCLHPLVLSCVVWPHGQTSCVMWTLPNGFVLCSRRTWYFPKPSIYCWSPVQVINGLTELWASVTKKGHMLWTESPKESLDWKLSHPIGSRCLKVTIIFCSNVDLFELFGYGNWTPWAQNIHTKCSESSVTKSFVYIHWHECLALAPHPNLCPVVWSPKNPQLTEGTLWRA